MLYSSIMRSTAARTTMCNSGLVHSILVTTPEVKLPKVCTGVAFSSPPAWAMTCPFSISPGLSMLSFMFTPSRDSFSSHHPRTGVNVTYCINGISINVGRTWCTTRTVAVKWWSSNTINPQAPLCRGEVAAPLISARLASLAFISAEY